MDSICYILLFNAVYCSSLLYHLYNTVDLLLQIWEIPVPNYKKGIIISSLHDQSGNQRIQSGFVHIKSSVNISYYCFHCYYCDCYIAILPQRHRMVCFPTALFFPPPFLIPSMFTHIRTETRMKMVGKNISQSWFLLDQKAKKKRDLIHLKTKRSICQSTTLLHSILYCVHKVIR